MSQSVHHRRTAGLRARDRAGARAPTKFARQIKSSASPEPADPGQPLPPTAASPCKPLCKANPRLAQAAPASRLRTPAPPLAKVDVPASHQALKGGSNPFTRSFSNTMTAALRESSGRREQSSSLKSMRLGLVGVFARGSVDEAGSHPVAVQIGSPKSVPCV
jgi:hypothetical protein